MWVLLLVGIIVLGGVGITVVNEKFADRAAFRNRILPDALTVERETGINHKITMTQAEHESNAGNSGLAQNYFNLFGIKAGPNWLKQGRPATPVLTSKNFANDSDRYRRYFSFLESMRDWANVLKTNYPNAYHAAIRDDVAGFVAGLQKGIYGSYAEDKGYGPKIVALYQKINSEVV